MSDDAGTKGESRAKRTAGEASVQAETSTTSSPDVVLLGPKTADGEGVHVLRARNERLEAGELRALRDGQPVTGEIVTLEPRKDAPRICDVRASYRPPTPAVPASPHKGPARVATHAYRSGWDAIFGAAPEAPEIPPRDLN